MNPVMDLFGLAVGSVLARTKNQLACPAFVIPAETFRSISDATLYHAIAICSVHIFVPLMTYLSPSLTAFVVMLATSDPVPGSVTQYEAINGSSVILPRYLVLRKSDPATRRGDSASPFASIAV